MIIKNNTINVMEYFVLILILSFFIHHNILLVILGIIFSLYFLNEGLIKRYLKDKIDIDLGKEKFRLEAIDEETKTNNEIYKPSLAETVEELGFIPSIENNNDSHGA